MPALDPSNATPATWGARGALTASFLANGIGVGAWAVLQPVLKDRLGLSDWELSNALLAYALGSALAMPGAALVSPRLGPGWTSALVGSLMGIFLILVPFAGGLVTLSVLAFLMGAMCSTQSVSMNAYGSKLETNWGAPIMSSLHGAYSVGALIGAAMAGALIGLNPNFAAWIPGVLVVAICLATIAPLGRGELHGAATAIFARPEKGMIGLCLLILFSVLIEVSMANWSAVYLTGVLGATASAAAAGFAGFQLGMSGLRLTGDYFVRTLGSARVVFAGGLCATAGLLLVTLAPALPVAVIGFVLIGMGIANAAPLVFSAASRLTASPASGVAMVSSCAYASFILGPPLIGFVATKMDLRMGMGVLLLSGVLLTTTSMVLRKAPAAR